MDRVVREHIEHLEGYVLSAGRSAHGREPIDMTPMAYVSGALHALERTGAITGPELRHALTRCHRAFGLQPLPKQPTQPSEDVTAVALKPEWADVPPWSHDDG